MTSSTRMGEALSASEAKQATSYGGNVWLLIMDVMSQSRDVTNEGIAVSYNKEGVLNAQYQQHLDAWKTDAAALPDAGKMGETGATSNINGKGISGLMIGGATGGLLAVAATMMVMGAATVPVAGLGAIFFAVAAIIIGCVYALWEHGNGQSAIFGKVMDEVPASVQYDQGKAGEASSKVQQDQTTVQQDQNNMMKINNQYIGPANDQKTQTSNMINNALQWYKNMVWSQGAA
ncbi:MAG: hypothetical protein HYX48_03455 [Chlamydiales bacterium]|nr:hypothetical protein [Chlamydiales bacterium]